MKLFKNNIRISTVLLFTAMFVAFLCPFSATAAGSGNVQVKIGMQQYTPALSSVPGYPFTISLKNPVGVVITVTADGGSLETWNRQTHVVKDVGKTYKIQSGNTIYWSPTVDGKSVTGKTVLIITAQKAGCETGRAKITITESKTGWYTAKR